jgi:hypothetical protein
MLNSNRAALPGIASLCFMVALILTLCCLLAGTNPETLKHMELYTLNTSRIVSTLVDDLHLPSFDPSFDLSTSISHEGFNSVFTHVEESITNQGNSLASEVADSIKNLPVAFRNFKNHVTKSVEQAKQEVSDVVSKADGAIKNATSEIVSAFINETIQAFHIHDFYVAHLLTYCEGNYTANDKETLVFCSNHKPNNKYNSTTTSENRIIAKGNNNDPLAWIKTFHLPDPVEYALIALTLLAKIISAFYVVGIISLFSSLVCAVLIMSAYVATPTATARGASKQMLLRWATLAFSVCALFTLILASSMVHLLVKKICGLFNEHPEAGVAAYLGQRFQGCSWASVILVCIAMILAGVDVVLGLAPKNSSNGLPETKRTTVSEKRN